MRVSWTRGIANCDVIDTDGRLLRFVLELEMSVGEMYHDFINNNIDSRFIVPRFTVSRINEEKGRPTELGLVNLLLIEDWHPMQLALLSTSKLHTD